MQVEKFLSILGAEFYTGVPDSQLKAVCDYLISEYGVDGKHHLIAANEGNAVALAAGYHLATGKTGVVYLQNSGEGNITNPVASLCNEKVYGIPMIFLVGWRGEPGIHDEPQHVFQGEITLRFLEVLDIPAFVIGKDTVPAEVEEKMAEYRRLLSQGKQVAFVIRKGTLSFEKPVEYRNESIIKREEIIRHILAVSGDDCIISTTGKASRELFELREQLGQGHGYDFLTVGSMGHSSSIALGAALQRQDRRFWIIDGDGALLMHMGSMAVIGSQKPTNLIHVVINNAAHESVGGQPTAAGGMDFVKIAEGCGYPHAVSVCDADALDVALRDAKRANVLSLIEVRCAIGARSDLGRPTTTAKDNKSEFMKMLSLSI